MAYDRLEPFGEQRADYRNAMLMALVANRTGNGEHEFEAAEFMPEFGVDEDEEEAEQAVRVREKARAIFGALGAK
jgi:hypothetical protein